MKVRETPGDLQAHALAKLISRRVRYDLHRSLVLAFAMDRYEGARKLVKHFYETHNEPIHFNALAELFDSRTTLSRGINALYQPGVLIQVPKTIEVSGPKPRKIGVLAYKLDDSYYRILKTYSNPLLSNAKFA